MERSDEHLLELALQGDGACFGELTERWQNRIFRFICRYTGNSEVARDLTQDTFTKAYQNLPRLSDPGKFSSWLYTIALNECRMRFRRLKAVTQVPFEDYLQSDRPVSGEPSPERALAGKERADILRGAFDDLPDEQRAAIVMKEYQGLKFQEIAEILDIPVSTAKSRVYLGLKTLRRLLERRL
ncbi:MAG TPA: sigma-70 family RNA polymerase sigma factor [Acidobacteriota bacterium]|nr:sigma-70 family RNA polymerase sigma factor [Acidobacteriota bacterium]